MTYKYTYSFTPAGTTTEINLFPVIKIVWNFPSNITYAGKIDSDTTLFFQNVKKQDTVKLSCVWVNKQIDGENIDVYFRDTTHKRYGVLKLKDKYYDAVISLPITEKPVSQGTAQTVNITFTIVGNNDGT